jgi:hypothetical protein
MNRRPAAITSVPAADVEGAVLDQVQELLAARELVARIWAAAKREGDDDITEREVTVLLADFATVWQSCSPPSRRASSSSWWSAVSGPSSGANHVNPW